VLWVASPLFSLFVLKCSSLGIEFVFRAVSWIAILEMQMTQKQQPALTLFAVGMIGLGILGLVYGDFALVWQPVAAWFPARTPLAYCAAVLMLLGGIGLLFEATVRWAIRILFPYLILWALLKVPAIVVAPQIEGVWLGFGELAVLLAGGWTLFARLGFAGIGDMPDRGVWKFVAGENGVRAARIFFGVFLIPIGLSHLMYVKETVTLVPHWLPFPIGWAYLTGAGQMACGLGVLFGVLPRVAALCEAGMISVFALLVWLPRIVAAPHERLPWTAFLITWAIGSAAWVVAANVCSRRVAKTKEALVT
jgi:uncharacterized membrane protein YphA (DoxX/SURF4 family)